MGNAIAAIFTSLGDPTNQILHTSIWIFHALVAFVFIGSIPYTKLSHIFTVPTNIYFQSLQPAGKLPPAGGDDGTGVKEWHQFTWKQILDFDSCTRCGRCQDECPAFASGMNLSPRDVLIKLNSRMPTVMVTICMAM